MKIRKKLKKQNFKKIILKHSNLPMNDQKIMLNKAFNTWKGNHEQIDDVLVIGVKV